jgi:AcrR family transcriptional regulator
VTETKDDQAEGQRRRRLHGAERRETFLDAAARIVIEQGPSSVTMEEVAARTGVNKRLGYRYFENRSDLLKALLERELEEAGRRAQAKLPPEPDLQERITVNVRVWLELVEERGPLLSRLFGDHQVSSKLAQDVTRRATSNWAAVLKEALDLSDARAEVIARIYLAGLRGAVTSLEDGVAGRDEIARIFTAVLLAGVDAVAREPAPPRQEPPCKASAARRKRTATA